MQRSALFGSVLAAALLIPAMAWCAPANAWSLDVEVKPPTVVVAPAQPTYTEQETVVYERPVERRVVERRVRYVRVPAREVVYVEREEHHHDNGRHRGHRHH